MIDYSMVEEDQPKPFLNEQWDEIENDESLQVILKNSSFMRKRLFDEKTYEFLFLKENKQEKKLEIILVRKQSDTSIDDYKRQKDLMKKCNQLYVMSNTKVISHEKSKFFVLFLEAKTTLLDWIKQEDLELSGLQCLRIGCNLALAIEDCYDKKICRLSMVPENIFLDNNNRMRLHCFQSSIQVNKDNAANDLNEKNLPPYEYYSRTHQQTTKPFEVLKKEDQQSLIDIFFSLFGKVKKLKEGEEEQLTNEDMNEIQKIKSQSIGCQNVSGFLYKLYVGKMITSKTKPNINESFSQDQISSINQKNSPSRNTSLVMVLSEIESEKSERQSRNSEQQSVNNEIQNVENNNNNNNSNNNNSNNNNSNNSNNNDNAFQDPNEQIKQKLKLLSRVPKIEIPNQRKQDFYYKTQLEYVNKIYNTHNISCVVSDFYEWAIKGYCFCGEDKGLVKYIALLKSEEFLDSLSQNEGIIIFDSQDPKLKLKKYSENFIKYDKQLFAQAVKIHMSVSEIAKNEE